MQNYIMLTKSFKLACSFPLEHAKIALSSSGLTPSLLVQLNSCLYDCQLEQQCSPNLILDCHQDPPKDVVSLGQFILLHNKNGTALLCCKGKKAVTHSFKAAKINVISQGEEQQLIMCVQYPQAICISINHGTVTVAPRKLKFRIEEDTQFLNEYILFTDKGFIVFIGIMNFSREGEITYEPLQMEIPPNLRFVACSDSLLLASSKTETFLLNLKSGKTQVLQGYSKYCSLPVTLCLKDRLLVIIMDRSIVAYEIVSGSFLSKYQTAKFMGVEQPKAYFLPSRSIDHQFIYLFDPSSTNALQIPIGSNIQLGIVEKFTEELMEFQNEETHSTLLNTLEYRINMLRGLQDYIATAHSSGDFSSCLRFLLNQTNLSLLNDGLRLLLQNIISANTLSRYSSDIEKQLIQLCAMLIQSKYEGHVQTGLNGLLIVYAACEKVGKKVNATLYARVVESKRVVKLLKSAKKKLFQLAYALALQIKGLQFIEGIDK